MAIIREQVRIENGELKIINGWRRDHFRFSIFNSQFAILCFLLALIGALFLAGCSGETFTSTRPVVKIGLIAPFEGLYRESGYEALAAMRSAIADSPLPGQLRIDILPLAVDDSADPERSGRAAAKMRADPAVAAVVGPLFPGSGGAVGEHFSGVELAWLPVFALNPINGYTRFPAEGQAEWATGLVQRVAEACRAEGCVRLLLAGERAGWPLLTEAEWAEVAQMPVRFDYPQTMRADDGVLWLGMPDAGADYLTDLRSTQPDVPFWLASPFGVDVFVRRADLSGPTFFAAWLADGYAIWAADHTPNSPAAFQIYQATQAAITAALAPTPHTSPSPPDPGWTVALFRLNPDGTFQQERK